jgi:hypothetical protein
MMACAKSSSWSTRPQAFSDLFVVKSMGRRRRGLCVVDETVCCRTCDASVRAEFADFIEHRIAAMSLAERQQFDRLLRLNPPPRR